MAVDFPLEVTGDRDITDAVLTEGGQLVQDLRFAR